MRGSKAKILLLIRVLLVIALLVFIIVLSVGNPDSKTSIDQMKEAVTSVLDLSAVQEGTNLDFKRNFSLNASDYDGIAYYVPTSAMNAEEILIVKLSDDSQADAVVSAINSRIDERANTFEGYAPEQYAMVNSHLLIEKGNYILFVVHSNTEAAKEAFNKAY